MMIQYENIHDDSSISFLIPSKMPAPLKGSNSQEQQAGKGKNQVKKEQHFTLYIDCNV